MPCKSDSQRQTWPVSQPGPARQSGVERARRSEARRSAGEKLRRGETAKAGLSRRAGPGRFKGNRNFYFRNTKRFSPALCAHSLATVPFIALAKLLASGQNESASDCVCVSALQKLQFCSHRPPAASLHRSRTNSWLHSGSLVLKHRKRGQQLLSSVLFFYFNINLGILTLPPSQLDISAGTLLLGQHTRQANSLRNKQEQFRSPQNNLIARRRAQRAAP